MTGPPVHLRAIGDLEIPQRPGAVVCVPPGADLLALAETNARALQASRAVVGGMPLDEFRTASRALMVRHAAESTAASGIPLATSSAGDLVVVTGHQPFFFHPGIWIKHLLVDRLAAMGAVGLSMAVDSDTFEEIGMEAPVLNGRLSRIREILTTAPDDVPYEAHPAPTAADWTAFLTRVGRAVHTLPQREVSDAFAAFAQRAPTPDGQSIGEFITATRRHYEGPRHYLELPVSQMSGTEPFRRFVLQITADAGRFAEIYNRHLRAYRQSNNIRTTAQPFPDLEVAGDVVELPFWLIEKGRRVGTFVQRVRDAHVLVAADDLTTAVFKLGSDQTIAALSRLVPEELDHLAIRPRALTLTAFTRLVLADLFVHGIGGARYDRVTDAVIRDFFDLTPPPYGVATATLHLPLEAMDVGPELQYLRRRLLDLQHNPERVLRGPTAEQDRLIAEKWKLIAELDRAELARKARRQATQRIRQINDLLSAGLDGERADLERRLAAVEHTERSDAAAASRTYPFCFFSPQAVDDLVSAQMEEPVRGH